MIDSDLFIANTESTLRGIVLATRVAKMIDRKRSKALAISSKSHGIRNYQYEIMSPISELNRMVGKAAPLLARRHFNAITEILARKLMRIVATEARSRIAKTVFPGLTAFQVNQIVTQQTMTQKVITKMLQGASPSATAAILNITANPAERRRLIDDYFRRLRNTAYASVRTGMAMVQSQVNRQVYDALPADVIGFQVLGILDNRIRPAHRERHGTIYYKNPGFERPGLIDMPNPPLEADGSLAVNCRCVLVPVFKGDETKARDIRGRVIPNAKVFSEWFDRQTPQAKIAIVGIKRYKAAQQRGPGQPQWIHFLDPKTGVLMTEKEIKNESNRKRMSRINKLHNQLRSMNLTRVR